MQILYTFALVLLFLNPHVVAAEPQYECKSFVVGSTNIIIPVPEGFRNQPRESMEEYAGKEKIQILMDCFKNTGVGMDFFQTQIRVGIAERYANQSISKEDFGIVLEVLEKNVTDPEFEKITGEDVSVFLRSNDILALYMESILDIAEMKLFVYQTIASIRVKDKQVQLAYGVKSRTPDSSFELDVKEQMQAWCEAILELNN